MDIRLALILAVIAVIVFRKPLGVFSARVFTPGVIVTFTVFVVLGAVGLWLWYWSTMPVTTFYGSRWEDETIEDTSGSSSQPKRPVHVELR